MFAKIQSILLLNNKKAGRYPDEAIKYLDKYFKKGDKRRGEAMALMAIAYFEGVNIGKELGQPIGVKRV